MTDSHQRIDPRQHISAHLNRARIILEARRSVRPLIVLAIGAAIGLGGFYYIYEHIGAGTGAGATRTVRFAAADATGVVAGRAEVRFEGIPAGIVTGVDMQNGQAVVTASILKKYGPIYRDARAEIRPNTPLQDMYLNVIDRGTKSAGPTDATPLPVSQTDTSVNIASVLQMFEPNVRDHMKNLLAELGQGLQGRGAQLRESFVALGPFIEVMGRLSRQLALHATETSRMVHNVGQLFSVLAERDRTLRGLIRDSSAVLTATADTRTGVDGTLRELPPTLRELDSSFQTVRGVLPDLDQAVQGLGPVASVLPGGLSALRGVSADAQPAVQALQQPLGELVPLSNDLRPFSQSLSGSVTTLRPQMADVARMTQDLSGCPLAPYMFFQWTASITKFDDALGAYPTGDFGFGADTISGVKDPGVTASPSCAPGAPKGSQP